MTKEKIIYWRPGGTLVLTTLSSNTTPSVEQCRVYSIYYKVL